MKQLSTLLLSFFLVSSLIGQYGLDPEVILFESVNGQDVEVKVEITNNTGEFSNIYWKFEQGENFVSDWSITICDKASCYTDKYKSSPNLPNAMEPGSSFIFKLTITANNMPGSSYGILHVYDDENFENEVATSNPPSVSVNEKELENLTVFPNPTQDYFSIRNDGSVHTIDIINTLGQVVVSARHTRNQTHSIQNFESGVFVVLLKDSDDKVIKSLYLHKK